MKYLLTLILFFSCLAFGQTYSNEYTAEEILEYFSNNFDVKEMLYGKLYQPSRFPDGGWKLTERQKIEQYISFSEPFKVHSIMDLEEELLNHTDQVHNLAVELAQTSKERYEDSLKWLAIDNIEKVVDANHLGFLKSMHGEDFELGDYIELENQKLVEQYLGGNVDKLYQKHLNALKTIDLRNYQAYYLVPVYYKKQHSGYLKTASLKHIDLDRHSFEEVKISKYVSWESLRFPHYPLRIDLEKAKAVVGSIEEPKIVDISHYGEGFTWPFILDARNIKEHLFWLFEEEHLLLNLKTGKQYQIQNSEGNPVSLSQLNVDTKHAPLHFGVAGTLRLTQEALYQQPALKVRLVKNKRLIISSILKVFQIALFIFSFVWFRQYYNKHKVSIEDSGAAKA